MIKRSISRRALLSSAMCMAFMSAPLFSQSADDAVAFDKVYNEDGTYTLVPLQEVETGLEQLSAEEQERLADLPGFQPMRRMSRLFEAAPALPVSVDNSTLPFFRPVFMQKGGSCAQASGVGYAFTYEMNEARNLNSSLLENQYPTHYTYNFLNGGSAAYGSWYFDGWEIIKNNGIVTEPVWNDVTGDATRWMSGYDNYFAGMGNRVESIEMIRAINTPEGLENLKTWLSDRGVGDANGGVACFATNFWYTKYAKVPTGSPEAGKSIVTQWGNEGGHAMTIVGYNDSICYDFNNDGSYTNDMDINGDGVVNMSDWEIGALKFVNSHGTGYEDGGFCYMSYKSIADKNVAGGDAIWNNSGVHIVKVKKENTPKTVLKVSMNHNKRNQIKLYATVVQGNVETIKEFSQSFNNKGGEFPMQGDKKSSAIELGLDVTSLFEAINPAEPAEFRINVEERDPAATGTGAVMSYSLMDYTGAEPREFFSYDENVEIVNNGTTTLSLVRDESSTGPKPQVRVEYRTSNTMNMSTQLTPTVRIHNTGKADLDLSTVKFEYYYTADGSLVGDASSCGWSSLMPAGTNLTSKVYTNTLGSEKDRTLMVWFKADAGSIKPGEYVDLNLTVRKFDWSSYIQGNDRSFYPTQSFIENNNVVCTVNDEIVWGSKL